MYAAQRLKTRPMACRLERGSSQSEGRRGSTRGRTTRLTRREQQIANLLLEGCDNAEIARQLRIAQRRVTAYFNRLFSRFGITSGIKRVKLATFLYRNSLCSDVIFTRRHCPSVTLPLSRYGLSIADTPPEPGKNVLARRDSARRPEPENSKLNLRGREPTMFMESVTNETRPDHIVKNSVFIVIILTLLLGMASAQMASTP